jgi:hypothetical protein
MNFNNLTKSLLILGILCSLSFPTLAQKKKPLKTLVKETMQLRRQGKYWGGLSPFKNYIVDSAQAMINNFKPYTSDTLETIRSLAYDAIAVTGQKAKNQKLRQSAVGILVDGCMDKQASMRKNIAKQLEHYLKPDFTEPSKKKLTALLRLESNYYENTIKLIGYLEMITQTNVLKAMLDSGKTKNKTLEWDIHLSLARLGNKDDIKYCTDLVRNTGLNDKVVYNLFPDLAYTHSREAIDYMIEVLNKDSKDCFSPNPDNPVKIPCAYRVMEFLAPLVKNFPLKTDKDGELDVDDYEKALIICREWFKLHYSDYIIDKDRF